MRPFAVLLFLACAPAPSLPGPTGPTDDSNQVGATPGGSNMPPDPPVVIAPTATTFSATSMVMQTAAAGAVVTSAPKVKVLDQNGAPIQGRGVAFDVTAGGGAVSDDVVSTNASGEASVTWTLGKQNVAQTLRASLTGGSTLAPVLFNATVTSAFQIQLVFIGDIPDAEHDAFSAAASRWSAIITNDQADFTLDRSMLPLDCGQDSSMLDVDDLVIFVEVHGIDGPGMLLGQAGPCATRSTNGSPAVGSVELDLADLQLLAEQGLRDAVIMHELGHAIGFGALWEPEGLLQNPSLTTSAGVDTYFSGPLAATAFAAMGGTGYTGGEDVPVENTAVAASADSHWREGVLRNELMTPQITEGEGTYPLSALTIASLADLGFYTVNMSAADPMRLTFSPNREVEPALGTPVCLVRRPKLLLPQ